MAKVLGLGGFFFKSKNPKKLGAWYRKNLGFDVLPWGGAVFQWDVKSKNQRFTVWSPFDEKTRHFAPSKAPYMVNLVVDDLEALIAKLTKAKAKIDKRGIETSEYGRFAWVMDPEGRKLELWEPPPK
ncbi:MAG: VOC family protein [Myxococcaceae bacterium]|nr:VOC family protein [Myxococcaceae bacterium]